MLGIIISLVSFAIAVKNNPNVNIEDVLPETNEQTSYSNTQKKENSNVMI